MICNVGDLVRIIAQPKNQMVSLVGSVGIVKEIEDTFIFIETINLDCKCNGSGWIPDCCVISEESSTWIDIQTQYLKDYDAELKKLLDISNKKSDDIANLASKYHLLLETFLLIYRDIMDLENKS